MGLLYSRLKIFHFKEKLDSLPLGATKEILPPLQVRIKPTNVCAHNCWYCAYRADNLQLGKDMRIKDHIPKEKMMEIIDDLAEMGVKSVTFSGGGDPFHYPYLKETILKLVDKKIKFASLTHGELLHGELAELFSQHATWIRVSMDGWDDESYTAYRKVKLGTFTKLMENLKRFSEMKGKCYLGVVIAVDHQNAEHIYDLIVRLKAQGVNSVKISPVIVSNDGHENNVYHKPIFQNVKEQIIRAAHTLGDEKFEIYDSYHDIDERFEKEYDWCPYLQICPVIGADLNVYPCHDKAYNLDDGLLGSLQNQRFKDFWFSDKNLFYKIKPSEVCNHHCVMNSTNKMILDYHGLDKDHLDFV